MTNNWLQAVLKPVLLLVLANPVSLVHGGSKQPGLTIVGPVVAYERSVLQLAQLTFVPNKEVVIVRVDKLLKGREPARYLKVVYNYGTDEPAFEKEIFDSRKQWRFRLKRDQSCDSSIGQMKSVEPQSKEGPAVSGLKFTSETDVLPDETSLPCYELKPGDYKLQK